MLRQRRRDERLGAPAGSHGRPSRQRSPGRRRAASLVWPAILLLTASFTAAAQTAPLLRPPSRPVALDTPNDPGGSITVRWELSPDDGAGGPQLTGYEVWRAESPTGPFERVMSLPRGFAEAIDARGVRDGVPYVYKIIAVGRGETAPSDPSLPAVSRAQWFHTGRWNTLIAVIVLSGLVIYFIERARRGGTIFIRKIAGLDAVDEAVGRATEMGRKILYIPGTSDMDNVQTLAGIAILGRVARLTAEYETPLEVPVSRSLVMVACRETVKEAYIATGRPDGYSDGMVYYLTDDQFGYAAALDGIMVREKPAAIFMQGSFYAESLVLAETGNSVGAIQIAGTAQASQLPFFVAACDYTLIGEELFVAGAYLSKEPRQLGSLKGQDMGKAIILVLLVIGIVDPDFGPLRLRLALRGSITDHEARHPAPPDRHRGDHLHRAVLRASPAVLRDAGPTDRLGFDHRRVRDLARRPESHEGVG